MIAGAPTHLRPGGVRKASGGVLEARAPDPLPPDASSGPNAVARGLHFDKGSTGRARRAAGPRPEGRLSTFFEISSTNEPLSPNQQTTND